MSNLSLATSDSSSSSTISSPVEVICRNLSEVGFKYTWHIEDYLKGVDGEIDVDSEVFEINVNGLKTKWSLGIRYWTDETGLRLTNPVVICLNLVSASGYQNGLDIVEELQARHQFGIWNNAVKQYEICPVGCSPVSVTTQTNQSLQSVGTREIMILDRHLKGKSIELFCKVMLVRAQEEPNTLALDLWTKLRNGENCDVRLRTSDGNIIPAHKTILTCRAAAIEKMIDDEGIIRLDMTTPLLTSLLQYIYTDRVDPMDNPQNLLKFAVKLELPGLKSLCEKALVDIITPANVASLLLVADTFECDHLKKSALAYCEENSYAIVKTVAWKVMEEVNPELFEEVCGSM